ncbi:MAG: hypothetical protein FWH03_05860 [Firmicutes bacterium]|nr:hypothetical protein [Bacillota bacterium]
MTAVDKKEKTKIKRNIGYTIFYAVTFAIIFVIGFFSKSFFAYDFFNHLVFDILYLLLTVALLIVRSIQTFLRQTALYGKIFTLAYFNMFALVFAVRPFVTNRIWAILLFASFIAATVLLLILAFKYIKAPNNYKITRFEPLVAMIPLLLLFMLAMIQSYVGASGMWIPIVVMGIVLAAAALFVFLKFFKNIDYFNREHKSEFIVAIILLIAACFLFSAVTVTTVNYAFDHSPTAVSFEIIDKRAQTGARQVTSFYFKIEIDGQEKEIDVPVAVYRSKEIGDSVEIKLYKGALGYGYYMYEYMGSG